MTIQNRIDALQAQIDSLKAQQQCCSHQWGSAEFASFTTGGYWDKPMHWHPGRNVEDVWVPEKTHPRWKRVCQKCGLVEYTEKAETKIVSTRQTPVF